MLLSLPLPEFLMFSIGTQQEWSRIATCTITITPASILRGTGTELFLTSFMLKPIPRFPRGRKLERWRKISAPTLVFLFVAYFLCCKSVLLKLNKQSLFKLLTPELLWRKKGSFQTLNSVFVIRHWGGEGILTFFLFLELKEKTQKFKKLMPHVKGLLLLIL